MSDPLYGSDADFSEGSAQDPIAGIHETPVDEFQHPTVVATASKLGHVKGGGNVTIDPDGTMRAPALSNPSWNNITDKPTTFAPLPHAHIQINQNSASSGTIPLDTNTITNLTTTFTSSHVLTLMPTLPSSTVQGFIAQVNFTIGASIPSIIIAVPETDPIIVVEWFNPEITNWIINKKYIIQFVWMSPTRIDIFHNNK